MEPSHHTLHPRPLSPPATTLFGLTYCKQNIFCNNNQIWRELCFYFWNNLFDSNILRGNKKFLCNIWLRLPNIYLSLQLGAEDGRSYRRTIQQTKLELKGTELLSSWCDDETQFQFYISSG